MSGLLAPGAVSLPLNIAENSEQDEAPCSGEAILCSKEQPGFRHSRDCGFVLQNMGTNPKASTLSVIQVWS